MASEHEEVLENRVGIMDSNQKSVINPGNDKDKSEMPNKKLEENCHTSVRRSQRPKNDQKYKDGVEELKSSTCSFNLQDKIRDPRFKKPNLIRKLENGIGFNYKFFQTNGFKEPLLFKQRHGLGD